MLEYLTYQAECEEIHNTTHTDMEKNIWKLSEVKLNHITFFLILHELVYKEIVYTISDYYTCVHV